MMRSATPADVPVFKKIWKDIFADTDNFIDWFFSQRFVPHMSFCTELGGEIACMMHCYPIKLKLCEKSVSAVMISGVATLPAYRRQGLMHKLFKFAMCELGKMGYSLCYYFPANPAFYKGLGHLHITDYLLLKDAKIMGTPAGTVLVDISQSLLGLEKCYNLFAKSYSGIVLRENCFESKMQEYIAEKLTCEAKLESGEISAYVIYYKSPTAIEIGECAGAPEDIAAILSGFNLPINGKLPPDFPRDKVRGGLNLAEGAMGGIINLQKLLAETEFGCPLTINVTDEVFPGNNGTFDFQGNPSLRKPDATLSAGELLQTLAGYRVRLPEFFPEYKCYTSDLY